MANFTKAIREGIVKEFATRHNGVFNPALFLEEVKSRGSRHPAFEWFEWDDGAAASAYRIEQARDFARDLKVSFRVEEITAPNQVRINRTEMPMVLPRWRGAKQAAAMC